MKPFILILSLFCLVGSLPAGAKAYLPTAREMIRNSHYIAVVDIDKPKELTVKGQHWEYKEVSLTRLEQAVKGDLPKEFKIHGFENFICAQCRFPEGRALVFLRKERQYYVGTAWGISCLPVDDKGQVAWFTNLDRRQSDGKVSLAKALAEIKETLSSSPAPQ
ncbi:MAG: hypothetical protein AB7W16_06245 [Candidatus Obscuribacterales bacterium]